MKIILWFLMSTVCFSQTLTLVIYKTEKKMEMWEDGIMFKQYNVCRMSGTVGPKRRQGDCQVPEGIYKVVLFNAASKFVLSFKIDYPNVSDKKFGGKVIGGDIFFHGKCASIGCVSFTDDEIREIYPIVKSYKKVNVLIFPCKKNNFKYLYEKETTNTSFWRSLETVLDYWEKNKSVPSWGLDNTGYYKIISSPATSGSKSQKPHR